MRVEGVSQGTHMHDLWTWPTWWGLIMELRVGCAAGGKKEIIGTVIHTNYKK